MDDNNNNYDLFLFAFTLLWKKITQQTIVYMKYYVVIDKGQVLSDFTSSQATHAPVAFTNQRLQWGRRRRRFWVRVRGIRGGVREQPGPPPGFLPEGRRAAAAEWRFLVTSRALD